MKLRPLLVNFLEKTEVTRALLSFYRRVKYSPNYRLLSVIIPAFNAENTIERCLKSICNQTYKKLEIIVVDDASTDGTSDVVQKLMRVDSRIRLIKNNKNSGSGFSRNIAINLAKGSYITFVDSDDYLSDNNFYFLCIQKLNWTRSDCVITPYLRSKSGQIRKDKVSSKKHLTGQEACDLFLGRKFGTHASCGKIFLTNIVKGCQYVNFGYSQDVMFMASTLLKCKSVLFFDKAAYVYDNNGVSVWHPTSITDFHVISSFRLLLESLLFYKENNRFEFKNWKRYIQLWNKDHGNRIIKFIEQSNGHYSADIYYLFYLLSPVCKDLERLISDDRVRSLLNLTGSNGDNYSGDYSGIFSYIKKKVTELQGSTQKKIAVILASHLRGGGLERVATQLSFILENLGYSVYFLLGNKHNVSYVFSGTLIDCNSCNDEIEQLLSQSEVIFDFIYKSQGKQIPIVNLCVNKYPQKYIATIHNTETCNCYFDYIRDILAANPEGKIFAALCVSEAVKQKFLKLYGYEYSENVFVLHNFVDLTEFNVYQEIVLNPVPKDNFLFVGRLNATEQKGIDLLIEGYLSSKVADHIKLSLYGGGKLDKELRQMVSNHPNGYNVNICSFSNNIYNVMKNSKCLVSPSRWEGFSMAHLEALASGIPVLSSKCGGAEEVIKHKVNGFLFETGNLSEFINGLNYMADHSEEMKKNCRHSVINFSREVYEEKLKNILKLLVSK